MVDHMYELGIQIGMAFQIKDDLFDYEKLSQTGKPVGNDIKEKKFTLPLIYALSKAENGERRRIIRKIKKGKGNAQVVSEVVDFVKKKGGVDFARKCMLEYKDKALDLLDQIPASEAREAMRHLVEFTVSRKK